MWCDGFLAWRVTIRFPRSTPSVPKVEESPNPGRWFQISKGLLILAVDALGQSKPLITKDFNRTARDFSCSTLYKGLIQPFPFFSHTFLTSNPRAKQDFLSSSVRTLQKPPNSSLLLTTFNLLPLHYIFLMMFHWSLWCPLRFSRGSVQISSLGLSPSPVVHTILRTKGRLLDSLSSFYFEAFSFLIHYYPCMLGPLSLSKVALLCHYTMAIGDGCRS